MRRLPLEEQAHDPFVNLVEQGLPDHVSVMNIVKGDPDYVRQFKNIFAVRSAAISIRHVAQALASFERALIAGDSAFDCYEYGADKNALSSPAQRGLDIFRKQAGVRRLPYH